MAENKKVVDGDKNQPTKLRTSTTHGFDYQNEISLTVALTCFKLACDGQLCDFYITLEDPNAGKFDDAVLRYREASKDSEFIISFQAKHKQTEINYNPKQQLSHYNQYSRKYDSTNQQKLASKVSEIKLNEEMWFQKKFHLFVEFCVSYIETLNDSSTDCSMYAMCTNEHFDKQILNKYFVETNANNNATFTAILNALGGKCFQLITSDVLQISQKLFCKTLAAYIKNQDQVTEKIPIFKMLKHYITQLVEQSVLGNFVFKEQLCALKAPYESGTLWEDFTNEYKSLLKKEEIETLNWYNIEINISNYFFPKDTSSKPSTSSDGDILRFFDRFYIITGTQNNLMLGDTNISLIPSWVSDKTEIHGTYFTRFFKEMGRKTVDDISYKKMVKWFKENNVNKPFKELKESSVKQIQSILNYYPELGVNHGCLDELFSYIESDSSAVHHFNGTSELRMNIAMIVQHEKLKKYEWLFVDGASDLFQNSFLEIIEFMYDVGLSKNITAITGTPDSKLVNKIENKIREKKVKVVIIKTKTAQHMTKDFLSVADLTEKSREDFFKRDHKIDYFGTVISLQSLIQDKETLSYLSFLFNKTIETQQTKKDNINKRTYDNIKSWYILRSLISFSEEGEKMTEDVADWHIFLRGASIVSFDDFWFKSDVAPKLLKSVVTGNDGITNLPSGLGDKSSRNIHVVLDDAGSGKSTYFTWLASYLSEKDSALYVIRMNASQYCTEYQELQKQNFESLDETTILRILYRLIHLTLFVFNENNNFDTERKKAVEAAELIQFTDGKIEIDTDEAKNTNLNFEQYLELQVFQVKFNTKQLVILLDGLDETAPTYKDFVIKLFGKLASFEGIHSLYISTRPMDFKREMENVFPSCKMYRFKTFSSIDQLHFVNNYFKQHVEEYKNLAEEDRTKILGLIYNRFLTTLVDLRFVPLFLHMACATFESKFKQDINFNDRSIKTTGIVDTIVDILQLIEFFVEEKHNILFITKGNLRQTNINNPVLKKAFENERNQNQRIHTLLAVKTLFQNEQKCILLSEEEQREADNSVKDATHIAKLGIITTIQEGIPQFTHRIFAEYFAALYFYENKDRIKNERFFKSWSYWNGNIYRTRDFFNRLILAKSEGFFDTVLLQAVVNKSTTKVEELLENNPATIHFRDHMDRLPLHLAVTYARLDIVQLFLNSKTVLQSINEKDHLFGWSALDYAFAYRYEETIKTLLEAGATVNEQILLEQILSNSLRSLLDGAHLYGRYLKSHEHSKAFASTLYKRVAQHLLNEMRVDLFSPSSELNSLSILEFCTKENMVGVFKQLVSQSNDPTTLTSNDFHHFLELAGKKNASDIIVHIVEEHNVPVTQIHNIAVLISATKHVIQYNQMNWFRTLFQQLCARLNIHFVEDSAITEDSLCQNDKDIPRLGKKLHPKVCCVRSSSNVRLPLPEYDENDVLHEGYAFEALLAHAIHEGNTQILRYIVHKTKTHITNNLIVKIMRLLPKGEGICHEKSMIAFKYLLDNITDPDSIDDEGRNLLHMTVQNGCFFMLHCLIAKGFDPSLNNPKNGWNVFHYAAFNEDAQRSDKMLEHLLRYGNFIWFVHLDKFLFSEECETIHKATSSLAVPLNTPNAKKLTKRQYALLAWFSLLDEKGRTILFSVQEHQEAMELIKTVAENKEQIAFIKGVQNDTPQFTHRIFAEYIAAKWVWENKTLLREKRFFQSWLYWHNTNQSDLYRLRDLFNRIVLKEGGGSNIHMAVINQSYEEVNKSLTQNPSTAVKTDAVGRLPFHLAVTYPLWNIVQLLLNSKTVLQSINEKDHLFGWSALDYAFANRYEENTKSLLAAGATVNEHILFEQILSNTLRSLLDGAHLYGEWLEFHEHSKAFASTLYKRVAQHLLNEMRVDLFSPSSELDSLSILEFCAKENRIEVFKQLVSQLNDPTRINSTDFHHFLEMACMNNASDIIVHIVEEHNVPVTQIHNIAALISSTKHVIQSNRMNFFKTLFQELCSRLNIHFVEDSAITEDSLCQNDKDIPRLGKKLHPKVCCVRSSSNVRLPLPEYDENDVLHEGYAIEALLAHAIHKGNTQILRYIVHKTKTHITNNLIVKIMRLLPKGEGVCHEKSMIAFKYLLDHTTNPDSIDDEGRNLLHMTVQNGCFFMLHCLIAKRFDPSLNNPKNGWNVFHYAAFNEDEHPSDKILEYLLKHCNFIWFDHLENLLFSEERETIDKATSSLAVPLNTPNAKKLTKRQYELLAWFSLLDEKDRTILFSVQELQEAIGLIKKVAESKEQFAFIKGVQNDTLQFTHRILAEYVAAKWVWENKSHVREKRFFQSWSYWHNTNQSSLYRLRHLFNRIVLKEGGGSDIHMAVINQSDEEVRKLLTQNPSTAVKTDAVGRLPFHLAVTYPLWNIVQLLLNSKTVLQSINEKDHLFGWSALDYAFAKRYEETTRTLLAAGATVNEQILLEQILSNSLRSLLDGAHLYGEWLQSHEHSKAFASTLYKRVAQHLLNEMRVDLFSPSSELDSLSILEFCTKENMVGVFKQLVSQSNDSTTLTSKDFHHYLELACMNNASDIIVHIVEEHNVPVTQIHNIAALNYAIKHAIQNNRINWFRTLFQQLCSRLSIHFVKDVVNVESSWRSFFEEINFFFFQDSHPLEEDLHPKVCCVRSSCNVRLPLPEYDENDVLHEGYAIEALLAHAIHKGNTQILRYIVHKTKTHITNNLIVKIMRLLPKGEGVCHEKSMIAFKYLLDHTTNPDSIDDEGRNLLHMTVQNGCFFMLHCLIAKRFDPSLNNPKNGWNVFHYAAFNEDEHPSDKILEYLLKHCNFIWFDHLENLLFSEERETIDKATSSLAVPLNTPNAKKLTKRQYALLAWFSLLYERCRSIFFSVQEHQEVIELIKTVTESNEQIAFIKGVQNDTPQFTHRIFAEYVAAKWMWENKTHVREKRFFQSWSYWHNTNQSSLYRLRHLFNRIVLKEGGGSDIHMAVINQSDEEVRKLLTQNPSAAVETDAVGRSPLHLAVTYPLWNIEQLLLNSKTVLQSINEKDHLFGWSALDYAFANRYEETTKTLLEAGATVNEQILLEQILSNRLRSLLYSAHLYGEWLQSHEQSKAFASTLYKRVAQHLLNEMRVDLFSPSSELDSVNILEFCAKENMIGVFKEFFSNENLQTTFSMENCSRLLKLASENEAHDIITLLKF